MPRVPIVAAVCVAAAVAVPSVAQGATVYQEGRPASGYLVQADSGETNLISVKGSRFLEIRDDGTPLKLARASNCKRLDTHAVRCKPLHRLDLDLQDGADVAVVDTPHQVEVEGGNGPDRYVATRSGEGSRVDFDGGIGMDVANYFFANAGVSVSVGLTGPDGRAGDDDQIRNTVESVIGSQFDDVLVGGRFAGQLTGGKGTTRSPAARGRTSSPAATGTIASTPVTARRIPSTAAAACSAGRRSTSASRPRSPAAPRSPAPDPLT